MRVPLGCLAAILFVALSGPVAAVNAPSNAGLKPQRLEANSRTNFFQLASEPTVGTLVLIHGCGPGARAFFPYDPVDCPECLGYPEYLAQTKQGLARGYNVLALQASNQGSNCWSSSTRGGYVDDRPDVVATVSEFLRNTGMAGMPLYFQGYSSGGTMLLKLPAFLKSNRDLRIDGLIPTDAAPSGGFGAEDEDGGMIPGIDFPPTIFALMERGKARQRAPAQIDFLRSNGVPADMISSFPKAVTDTYFSDRIPGLSQAQSSELVAGLARVGALDAQGNLQPGYWLDLIMPDLPWLSDGLTRDSVVQEMRIAVGDHENLGEFTTAALAWLESGGKANVEQLVRELVPARLADVTIDRRLSGTAAVASEGAPELAPGGAPAPAPGSVPVPTSGA